MMDLKQKPRLDFGQNAVELRELLVRQPAEIVGSRGLAGYETSLKLPDMPLLTMRTTNLTSYHYSSPHHAPV
jgi:hypothetical protein